MLEETTNVDTPVVATAPAPVEPVVAEPIVASELEPIVVVEPAVVAVPTESVEETVSEPIIVAEQLVAVENPVVIEQAPAIDAIAEPVVVEPVTAVEQPAPIVEEPAVPQSGDLGLTPQTVQFEALSPEIPPEIPPVQHVVEPVQAIAEPAQMPTQPTIQQASQAQILTQSQPTPEVARPIIAKPQNIFYTLIAKGRATIQARKRKKLDRIMGLFAKQASVVNDDAEKLLHISDATACRYLGILEKEGKIKRVGTAGRWVSYTKV